MPKQDGNIKIVESFITSNKPMSLNNKNIYYNEYSDEVLIRYYQTLIAVRKDKSVRILEGINKYSASTNVLVRLIERIAKEKGCTVTYVKQFAKGSTVKGGVEYWKDIITTAKGGEIVSVSGSELAVKYNPKVKWKHIKNGKVLGYYTDEMLNLDSSGIKHAKGSTVKGDIVFTNKEVYDNGEVVDSWASDIGGSNESQDNIVEYKGDKYLVSINVEDNEVIRPKAKALIYEQEYAKGSTVNSPIGIAEMMWNKKDREGKKEMLIIAEYSNNVADDLSRENWSSLEKQVHSNLGRIFQQGRKKSVGQYAKGSTIKGKDFSGNYYSTNDFVGAHNLQKEAEKILGKGWEAEDDVNQIESIINSLGGKYVVTVPEDRSQWNEMREQYDLAKPTNDSNYDIFVISESDFKYGNGGGVAVSSESGLAVGTNADLMMNQNNLQYRNGGRFEFRNTISRYNKMKELYQTNRESLEEINDYVDENYNGKKEEFIPLIYSVFPTTIKELGLTKEDFVFWLNDPNYYQGYFSEDNIGENDYARGGNMSMGFNYEIGGL